MAYCIFAENVLLFFCYLGSWALERMAVEAEEAVAVAVMAEAVMAVAVAEVTEVRDQTNLPPVPVRRR